MKIAILHFHLRTGGVTTVIRHQIDALGQEQTLLITGEKPTQEWVAPTVCVPDIAYDTERHQWPSPEKIADRIQDAIAGHWPTGCDLIHVHNPTLGKNRDLLPVLEILSRRGIRLFLQIHDLSEDGRPHLYSHAPYPADCHYGVINQRDFKHLKAAGLKDTGIHLIENAVVPLPTNGLAPPQKRYVLYPVRAIRRKNIGEAMLLSTYMADPLWITLAPTSQMDVTPYQNWKRAAKDLNIPVVFAAGENRKFRDILAGARSTITTSVSEGFGFALLEPWTANQYLWGRAVPYVTEGFQKAGLWLDHLYDRLVVSLDWFSSDAYRERWQRTADTAGRKFGQSFSETDLKTGFDRLTSGNVIDFAYLDEPAQHQVLIQRRQSDAIAASIKKANPILHQLGDAPDKIETIRHNQKAIMTRYHPNQYGATLLQIYQTVMTQDIHQRIDKEKLLALYFRPETLSLLKWSPHGP